MWVFTRKRDSHGRVTRYKARLVILGNHQRAGVDYRKDSLYAPVAKFSSLRLLLSIATVLDYEVHQMDVVTAFLNGTLEEEIYMEAPPGFEENDSVWQLLKALYGLRQAPNVWNKDFDKTMVDLGFMRLKTDTSLYVRTNDGNPIYVLVYVDDLIITTQKLSDMNSFKDELKQRYELKDFKDLEFVLGMLWIRDRKNRRSVLSQGRFAADVLERFQMTDCNPAHIPMETSIDLTASSTPLEDVQKYQEVVGSLIYLTTCTRPDLSYAVGVAARYMAKPEELHWKMVKRILRYLQGTQGLGLVLDGSKGMDISCYADANWAGDVATRRSTTGFLVKIGNCPVSWSSKRQTTVALSTTEAEYMSVSAATQEVVWIRNLLEELGLKPTGPTTVYQDNQGAIAMSKNPVQHGRTKHIDIRHHYVRDCVELKKIRLEYISTKKMIADVFTKPLAGPQFTNLCLSLGVTEVKSWEGVGRDSPNTSHGDGLALAGYDTRHLASRGMLEGSRRDVTD
jgi:hypothetical protein